MNSFIIIFMDLIPNKTVYQEFEEMKLSINNYSRGKAENKYRFWLTGRLTSDTYLCKKSVPLQNKYLHVVDLSRAAR